MLLEALLHAANVVMAAVLVVFAFVAYRGEYASRKLFYVLKAAVLLGLSQAFAVWFELSGERVLNVLHLACFFAAMLVLFMLVRQYIHAEIELAENGELLPRKKAFKRREKRRSKRLKR